ncbi:MAG: transcriptional regulator, partial [Eubacteriales bacterium]|nr:transcriptional regulator [Eubacteriales bacterium]
GLRRQCTRVTDYVSISLLSTAAYEDQIGEMNLPVGGFSQCGGILPTCGLADRENFIGVQDQPLNFYLPERLQAQILWFRQGFVEYHFPILPLRDPRLYKIEIAFEACSETIGYDNHCQSDIFVEVNGISLGTWRSPGDFGGRSGLLNPSWWPSGNTQFGMLKTWAITQSGVTLDGEAQAATTLSGLRLDTVDYLSLRIGVRADAKYPGGLNLFGKEFGDFPIDIVLRYYITKNM